MYHFYVYELIDPRDHKVFYVGKGTAKRMYTHMHAVRRNRVPNGTNSYLYCKLKQLLDKNIEPLYVKIFETNDEQEAFEIECHDILFHGRENLCNLTDGGEGVVCERSEEWSQKISQSLKGKHLSEKHKEKLRQINLGSSNPNFGLHRSEETKLKISIANRGKATSIHKGDKRSIETRRKISQSKMGHNVSEETRQKISAAFSFA